MQLNLLDIETCGPAHGCAGFHAYTPETIAGQFERCSQPAPLPWAPDRRCRCQPSCPCHTVAS